MKDYTYIAADFDHDKGAVDCLYWMRRNGYIYFKDAHDIQQSNDDSLACSIKKSLRNRLDQSYKFILIVGDHTDTVTKGGCQLCGSYNSHTYSCGRGYTVDYRSFIKFECDKAVADNLKIVVLYNSGSVDRSLCPEAVRWKGTHQKMWYRGTDGKNYWDYNGIANAIDG
ncbi:MAG: molecular chaperone Tir [Firmicutes bacterium]|nr:molecular chaperone Tir [Bacillota bacterium]